MANSTTDVRKTTLDGIDTNETENGTDKSSAKLFSGLSSGDKTFVEVLISIVLVFAVKRFFDSSDKAMERGYDVTFSAKKYGDIKFTHGSTTQGETESENASAEESQDPDSALSGEAPEKESDEGTGIQ